MESDKDLLQIGFIPTVLTVQARSRDLACTVLGNI